MKREVSPGPLGVGGGGELQLLHCPRATWYILVLCPPQSGGGMVSSCSLLYPVTRWIVVKIAFARAAPPLAPYGTHMQVRSVEGEGRLTRS